MHVEPPCAVALWRRIRSRSASCTPGWAMIAAAAASGNKIVAAVEALWCGCTKRCLQSSSLRVADRPRQGDRSGAEHRVPSLKIRIRTCRFEALHGWLPCRPKVKFQLDRVVLWRHPYYSSMTSEK